MTRHVLFTAAAMIASAAAIGASPEETVILSPQDKLQFAIREDPSEGNASGPQMVSILSPLLCC